MMERAASRKPALCPDKIAKNPMMEALSREGDEFPFLLSAGLASGQLACNCALQPQIPTTYQEAVQSAPRCPRAKGE